VSKCHHIMNRTNGGNPYPGCSCDACIYPERLPPDVITGVDIASGPDKVHILCLSCYREDCEHAAGVLAEVEKHQEKPFFTVLSEPIPPEYYHNVVGRDGIFDPKKLIAHEHGCGFPHLDGKCLRDVIKTIAETPGYRLDLDPPSYLPLREHEAPRIPDLNADNWNTQQGYGLSGKTIELPVYNHKHNECRMCGLCIYCETCKCLDYGIDTREEDRDQ
jgi:hypothetical protein